ncbi:MAG: helix-turn-helix domain-containing protein [Nitrospinae bacterium]|nr:helix-turn-helix domain-containing protein [Nitrospinota bacterium]
MKNANVPETKAEPPAGAGRKLLSIAALSRRWSVSDTTIKRLIEEGELKGMKIRRSYRVFMESVVEYESRSRF